MHIIYMLIDDIYYMNKKQTSGDSRRIAYNWDIVKSAKFDKLRTQYSRDKTIYRKLQESLALLSQAQDPGRLGRLKGVYALGISKSIRLLYIVDYDMHQIRLLVVGDHKVVYGRD